MEGEEVFSFFGEILCVAVKRQKHPVLVSLQTVERVCRGRMGLRSNNVTVGYWWQTRAVQISFCFWCTSLIFVVYIFPPDCFKENAPKSGFLHLF